MMNRPPKVLHLGLIAAALFAPVVFAQDISQGSWVDLTHAFNERSIYWPTAEPFKKTKVFHGHTPGGWFYSAYNFSAAEHGGTHIDAPIHFAEGARTVDKVPVSQLIGPGFIIDVSRQAAADVDYLVSVADIESFEAAHGQIPEGAIVLLNTGRAKLYGHPEMYMGTTERGAGALSKLHFPGLSPAQLRFWSAGGSRPSELIRLRSIGARRSASKRMWN